MIQARYLGFIAVMGMILSLAHPPMQRAVRSKAANVKAGRGAMSSIQRVRLELSRPVAPKFEMYCALQRGEKYFVGIGGSNQYPIDTNCWIV
ncbi:hypothetical protein LJR220_003447 [Bradyrhizobium sp. LjRoot220]|uniref:hypothetical protein n=1 Tax=Bradyrhizobium sp. LjRoot220 TaxID=3342284 RepID=UPI003ECDE723